MLPTFVIIGAQKSASTFLQACLNDHPDIYLPDEETPFFESPDYERSDIRELETLFARRGEECLGIKRPTYLCKPEVPARLVSHLPDARLIAVLRNPIDRAISAYYHNIKYGFIPPINVEIGMRTIISEASFSAKYRRSPEVIEFGYYHRGLKNYDHYEEKGQLLVLLHEDILSKPLESVQKVYDFLGVSRTFIPGSLNSRPKEGLYSLPRLKFLCLRNRFMYVYNQDRTRLVAKNMTFMDKVLAGSLTMIDRAILSQLLDNTRPRVGAELRTILYETYAGDIESLESLLGRDLSGWRPN